MPTAAEWAELAALQSQGYTADDLLAIQAAQQAAPTQNPEQSTGPGLLNLDSTSSSPGPLGATTNEEYRAAKLANLARMKAQSDEARAIRGTDSDPFRYNPRFNDQTGYYYDRDGNFGLGILPENYYYNDALGAMVEGQAGYEGSPGSPLSLGGGAVGPTAGREGDDIFSNPFADASGGNGLPNGGIPNDYLLDDQGNGYWDQPNNGGDVPINWPGTGAGSNTPTGNAYTKYVQSQLELGNGGINVDGGQAPIAQDVWDSLVPDKTGYESSSNKDFYQKQFQDMRTQEAGNDMRELGAAIRAQEAANAPAPEATDPWGWANLPEVQMGGSVGATPIEWGLNPNITSGMTNQQVVGALGGIFNTDEAAMMAEHFRDNPDSASATRWSTAGSPAPLLGNMGTNSELSPNFANVLQKVFNNTYTQTGGGTGGISVPDGYANPIGA